MDSVGRPEGGRGRTARHPSVGPGSQGWTTFWEVGWEEEEGREIGRLTARQEDTTSLKVGTRCQTTIPA